MSNENRTSNPTSESQAGYVAFSVYQPQDSKANAPFQPQNIPTNQSYYDPSLNYSVPDFSQSAQWGQSTQEFPFPSPTPQPTQQPQSQPQSVIYNKESQTQRLVDVPQGRPQKSTSSGLSPALLVFIAYFFSWVGALCIILFERRNLFVQFHAWQSLIVSGITFLLWLIFVWSVTGFLIMFLFSLVVATLLIIKAILDAPKQKLFKLPLIGKWCEKRARARVLVS